MYKKQYYYFYWDVNTPEQIEAFEKNYRNAKYDVILQSLKNIIKIQTEKAEILTEPNYWVLLILYLY